MFEGDWKLRFHLAPPLLAGPDPVTGEPREARLRPVDAARLPPARPAQAPARHPARPVRPHGRAPLERQLIADYEAVVDEMLAGLTPDNHATAVELAAIPDRIRGFGPVKERFLRHAKAREAELLEAFRRGDRRRGVRRPRHGVAVMAG